jgi:FixJ family two-component response regulator
LDAIAKPPPVVIVDDDAALLAALRFAFETEGLVVAAYPSAEAMLDEHVGASACLVLDYRLPGMSGLDLYDRLRARGSATPAVLITSNPVASTRARARAFGIPIVEKPLLGDALRRIVAQFASAH